MNISEEKSRLRKEIKQKRLKMTESDVQVKSNIICNKIINSQFYKESKCIYCYMAIQNEVDLSLVIRDALLADKTVAVPKVVNKNGQMYFAAINKNDKFENGLYKIPEPSNTEIAPSADLILVPGVVFSTKGERIGQAGGFYDRYLRNSSCHSIGVAYDFQVFDEIPTELHDVPVNEIISNN